MRDETQNRGVSTSDQPTLDEAIARLIRAVFRTNEIFGEVVNDGRTYEVPYKLAQALCDLNTSANGAIGASQVDDARLAVAVHKVLGEGSRS